MFSDLKRLSRIFTILAIISAIFSLYIILGLYSEEFYSKEYEFIVYMHYLKQFFILNVYPWICPPILFTGVAIAIKRIEEEMRAKYSTIYEERKNLEKRIEELEKEKNKKN